MLDPGYVAEQSFLWHHLDHVLYYSVYIIRIVMKLVLESVWLDKNKIYKYFYKKYIFIVAGIF